MYEWFRERAGWCLAGLVIVMLLPPAAAAAGGEEREAACAAEAERLVLALDGLWPGWAAPGAAALPQGPADASALISATVIGGGRELLEAAIAQRVASAFRTWSATVLPEPPAFSDSGPGAPEAWARKALLKLRSEEAGALRAALMAPKAKHAREHAIVAARVRFRIVALLRSEEVDAWRHDELQEGLGVYAAYQGLLLGRHASYEIGEVMSSYDEAFAYAMASRLREMLLARLAEVEEGRVELYTPELSGFATALVLDRIRHGWREELRMGWRSLDALLVRQARPFGSKDVPGD